MNKYLPLERFLSSQDGDVVEMSFEDIENVIGDRLPPVSRKHRAWWSNNSTNSVMTAAWLRAGFKSERVDMGGEKVVFRRTATADDRRGASASDLIAEAEGSYAVQGRHPLIGALKGMVRIESGTDLTLPADPNWGEPA